MATLEFLGATGTVTGSKHLVEAAGRRVLALRIFGEDVVVRARVETIHGLSAHADSEGLMRWLHTASRPPKRVFVVHGDPGPAQALATRIDKELGWAVSVPAYRDRVPIE